MRAVRKRWRRLERGWRAGLRRLPFFTQRTAVLLVGVLVASLAMLGGVVALVGWPGASGPNHLVPGERAGQLPESRPGPGAAAPGGRAAGDRSGADGAAASPSPAPGVRATAGAVSQSAGLVPRSAGTSGTRPPGGAAVGARGSGGAAGAGAGGPPAAPPTTTTTIPARPLDPVDDLLGPVVSTLLP